MHNLRELIVWSLPAGSFEERIRNAVGANRCGLPTPVLRTRELPAPVQTATHTIFDVYARRSHCRLARNSISVLTESAPSAKSLGARRGIHRSE
jgi:hypothetical protein